MNSRISKRQDASVRRIRNRLQRIPGFENFPASTIALIDRMSTEMTLPAGTMLTRQGGHGAQVFILLEGSALVRRDGKLCSVASAGALIGELAVLHGTQRRADTVAATEVRLLVMNPAEFASLADDPTFSGWVQRQVAQRGGRADVTAVPAGVTAPGQDTAEPLIGARGVDQRARLLPAH